MMGGSEEEGGGELSGDELAVGTELVTGWTLRGVLLLNVGGFVSWLSSEPLAALLPASLALDLVARLVVSDVDDEDTSASEAITGPASSVIAEFFEDLRVVLACELGSSFDIFCLFELLCLELSTDVELDAAG
jgi:hypothetical protein